MDVLRDPLDGDDERLGDDTLGEADRNDGVGLLETLGRDGADTLGADDRYEGDGLEGELGVGRYDGEDTDGPPP